MPKTVPSAQPEGMKARALPGSSQKVTGKPKSPPRKRGVHRSVMEPIVIRRREGMVYQLADQGPLGVPLLEAQGFTRVVPSKDGPAVGIGPLRKQAGVHEFHGQTLMEISKEAYASLQQEGGFGCLGQAHFDAADAKIQDTAQVDPSRGIHPSRSNVRVQFDSSSEGEAERAMAVTTQETL